MARAHCRRQRETPSLFAVQYAGIGRKASIGHSHDQRQGQEQDRRRHARAQPGRGRWPRLGQGKVPSETGHQAAGAGGLRCGRGRLRPPHERAGPAHRHRQWPPAVCHGRHHEPPADLGHGAGPAGRHVPRREGDRRSRRAARLFPRRRRVPGLQVGVRSRCAGRPDDARHLRRRLHPDRQGAEPRAQGGRRQARQCAGLRRRLHGGGRRRPVRARRRAGAAGRAGVPVPGRLGRARRARLPRDRPPHARRLLRLRCRLGRSSCATCSPPLPSMPPAAARRSRR